MRVYDELICRDIGYDVLIMMRQNKERYITSANTKAIDILEKIKGILVKEELSDFEVVEEIVSVLEKNNIDCGGCHDFG